MGVTFSDSIQQQEAIDGLLNSDTTERILERFAETVKQNVRSENLHKLGSVFVNSLLGPDYLVELIHTQTTENVDL